MGHWWHTTEFHYFVLISVSSGRWRLNNLTFSFRRGKKGSYPVRTTQTQTSQWKTSEIPKVRLVWHTEFWHTEFWHTSPFTNLTIIVHISRLSPERRIFELGMTSSCRESSQLPSERSYCSQPSLKKTCFLLTPASALLTGISKTWIIMASTCFIDLCYFFIEVWLEARWSVLCNVVTSTLSLAKSQAELKVWMSCKK